MKRILCLSLMLICLTVCACAQEMQRSAALTDPEEQYTDRACFGQDPESVRWHAAGPASQALIWHFETEMLPRNTETLIFTFEACGDAELGTAVPLLCLYYSDGRYLSAGEGLGVRAVSVLSGDERLDFAARSETVRCADGDYEKITAPLNREAFGALDRLIAADPLRVRLFGEKRAPLTPEADLLSQDALRRDEDFLRRFDFEHYLLWDANDAAWLREYGYAPAFEGQRVENGIAGETVEDPFGMILPGDGSGAAKAAMTKAFEAGFLAAVPEKYNEEAMLAVKAMQRRGGRIETGCADARLFDGEHSGVSASGEEPYEEIVLRRCWFARAAATLNGAERKTAVNGSRVLFIADGLIRNDSAKTVTLFLDAGAKLRYTEGEREAVFDAEICCESNRGMNLDSQLLPMEESRVIVWAEVPRQLAQRDGGVFEMEITLNDSVYTFTAQTE